MNTSIVNGLREKIADKANLMNVELATTLGEEIGARYEAKFAGTHVLLDKAGTVLYFKHGTPDVEQIIDMVEGSH